MDRYDERLELAPRDVVSHAIIEEKNRTGSDNFFLDISYKDSDFIRNRFPMIYQKVLEQGYDMTKEPIPIYPCQHYLMGGIQVDTNSETTIPHLYAAGECSNTGVHGNNRLASNSLLEALVFSRRLHWILQPSCRLFRMHLQKQLSRKLQIRCRCRRVLEQKSGRSCRTAILSFRIRQNC